MKTLMNLIPFYRSDGYWIVSDFFEVANLYATSIKSVKKIIFRLKKCNKTDVLLSIYFIANLFLLINFMYYVLILRGLPVLFQDSISFFSNLIINKNFDTNLLPAIFILFSFLMFCYRLIKKWDSLY